MKRPVSIRVFPVLATGLLLCGIGLFWPASTQQRPFTVAVNIWPGAEGVLSARQAESFKNMPVSFMEFSWSAAVLGAFQKRVVDAAVVSLDELLLLEEGDAQPVAVLVVGTSKGSDAILARPGIQSVADLRGKRVGLELQSSSEYLLMTSLKKHGVPVGEIEIVPLNLAETESAYLDKDLDAVVTADPWRVRLQDKGAVLLDDSSDLGLEMSRVLVVRRDAVKKFGPETRSLVATCLAHARSAGPCFEEEEGFAAVLRREGLTRAQWQTALGLIHLPGAGENTSLLEGGLIEVLQQVQTRMRASGILERGVKVEPLINAGFVKEVR